MSPIPAGTPVGLEIPAKDVARGKLPRRNRLSGGKIKKHNLNDTHRS